MKSPDRRSTRKKANNGEEGVKHELVPSISTLEFNEHETERSQDTSTTPRSGVPGESEVTGHEFGDEEHHSDDELEDEEEERDPNDIVHRRVVTATPTLKQQFLPLFNNSHYPDHKVFEWKETHRNEKCERCATLGLPCTSNLGDRKLVCHECNSTNTKKCSRLNNFRKEFIMKKMGINEPLWEVLKEAFLEDKSQKTIQKRIEKARHMEEAEEQGTEEDELDSNLEDEPQGIATSTKRDSGTRDKRKHMTVDDGGFISRSIPNSPPAKKGKVMPEVVIDKSILKKIKSREHKNSKAAGSKNVKRSKSSTKTNTNLAERNTSDVASIVEPADTGDVVSGSKRPRGPTIKAKIAEAEHRKRRKLAENDTILDLDTHGHGHGSSIDAPIATAAINTKSAPTGATTGVKASSSQNSATTNVAISLPPFLASLNIPSTPAQKAFPVHPNPDKITTDVFDFRVHSPSRSCLLPPRPIPPELSLSVLKRALEDISSDLRYNRIDIPSAMAKFDEVADRIGRRADLCVVLGTL
ncbi:hypothetical protein AAF712_016096 [Marasmius tenuissimus]|uniref:Uncharacterized protein n=1 Tax=Marasmius tenuissimus TaxID=585030 RepID=A0ABR2Z8P8_9AGAR